MSEQHICGLLKNLKHFWSTCNFFLWEQSIISFARADGVKEMNRKKDSEDRGTDRANKIMAYSIVPSRGRALLPSIISVCFHSIRNSI